MTIDGTDEVLRYAENIPITPDEAVEPAIAFAAVPRRKGAFRRLLRRPGPAIALGLPRRPRARRDLRAAGSRRTTPNEQDIPNQFATPSWSHCSGPTTSGATSSAG